MTNPSMNIVSGIILALTALAWAAMYNANVPAPFFVCPGSIGLILACSPRLIREWERGVLLRLGRYRRNLNPGISWVIPGIDRIVATVDMRIRSTPFTAEKTLTKENGALMVVPSGMIESLNTGVIGLAAAGFRTELSDPTAPENE